MLIVEVQNITGDVGHDSRGRACYHVQVKMNRNVIWEGDVSEHIRHEGAGMLLRRIADAMEKERWVGAFAALTEKLGDRNG